MNQFLEQRPIQVCADIVDLARNLVGKASWKLKAKEHEAPYFVDCSSLTKRLYLQKGILIPRLAIDQFQFCRIFGKTITLEEVLPGDLIFVGCPFSWGIFTGEQRPFGHVCLVSGQNTIVCASNSELGTGVLEISFEQLFRTRAFSGAGRIIPEDIDNLLPNCCNTQGGE